MPKADEEGMSPIERGRSRYQRKEYPGALEAFTEAVNHSTGNLLFTALDHRAATYEKLEQLQLALRDSKQMIDLKPELAKGYLRCAKVLQLMGKRELALKIYERGLTKVKIGTDDNRATLQTMFTKLRNALNPGISRDPLMYLPLEMVEIIIDHLDMRDRVICLAVLKSWKRLLESSYKIWTTFDTTRTRKAVSQNSLKIHLRRSNYTLNTAIISARSQFDAKKLTFLTKTCKQLKHLEFNGTGIIGDSLVTALPFAKSLTSITISTNYTIGLSAVMSVLKICQETLKHARFLRVQGLAHSPPGLKLDALETLHIDGPREFDQAPFIISEVFENAPNLKTISCHHRWISGSIDLSKCKQLENIELVNTSLTQLPKLSSTIRTLNLSSNSQLTPLPMQNQDTELYDLPLLESFACDGATQFNGADIKLITQSSIKAGNLKILRIGNRMADTGFNSVAEEYPASQTVEELSLSSCALLSEKRILDIVELYQNLKRLDISYTKITGVAVKIFIEKGIKWLAMNECNHVGADAVDYARSQGVEVEFDFPSRRRQNSYRDRIAL